MSSQSDVNIYPNQFILYYCNNINADTTIYNIYLSDVCTTSYDSKDNLEISAWLISAYIAPTNVQLTSYILSTVLDWYNNFYTIPQEITDSQAYMISAANLALCRADASMIGFTIYDTTNHAKKNFNGTAWVLPSSQYLSTNGGVVNGNISQTLPSCLSIGSSDNVSTSFTSNTPKLISITGFSQTLNANNDFSFNSITGECKYTGSITRPFRVTIQYSYAALALASTMTNFISKNSSTTIPANRTVITFLLLGQASVFNSYISTNISLATNDTIILGGQLSTNNSVNIQAVSYNIEQI